MPDAPYDTQDTDAPTASRPHLHPKPSFLDELLPSPVSSSALPSNKTPTSHAIRRSLSVGIIAVFLLSVIFMAANSPDQDAQGVGLKAVKEQLKGVFGVGSVVELGEAMAESLGLGGDNGSHSSDAEEAATSSDEEAAADSSARPKFDFDKYRKHSTIRGTDYDLSSGHRLIFIGDVHGSYDPLLRLTSKLKYSPSDDTLIHVGDLVAKGSKHEEVLQWMRQNDIKGVRGNHDHPVIQWRTWMEWVGGEKWQSVVDDLADKSDKELVHVLGRKDQRFPEEWKWKGEHWEIARSISKESYEYLVALPLTIHFPSLHTFVVHAGLLPSDLLKSQSDDSQPLVHASNASLSRKSEELELLYVAQNMVPWNLMNMRSVYTKGKKQGTVTKKADKGTPWSEVWNKEMTRCKGPGVWGTEDEAYEWSVEQMQVDDVQLETVEEGDKKKKRQKPGTPAAEKAKDKGKTLDCSPVSVIYGHAAGRGLDIKPFSKGLDSGCVYGRRLTALVLGDLSGLEGQRVRLGDQKGLLVSVECEEGGL
ncbi:hypothetical protein L202_04010 [Cryptococcus amylolentus CBS 6039]|uniref:Calcineurin-like phosphoesterase domain-containing protein n=2 Tax=Cryptococcus amylolentus TaxID=104669 RepID=A0A1E3HPT5_9TREE|nr:hypothetical protein L202_04010 [Cryptococcus amylolentus CBS 6039]ODN78369.1 hypothetical protein L202_04010 [Cryptococcus amylolentus CBS 6039]ODO07035.1 hypothetical protein I350_04403 [Cryptococcus amylolentus CBS 6273]